MEKNEVSLKKILVLSANPKNTPKRRLNEVVREIEEGLQLSKHRAQFKIKSKWAIRFRELRRHILDFEPQIVHFCGYGKKEGLVVENEGGNAVFLSTKALYELFELFSKHVECVILSACYSEPQANVISKHIDYVIGMRSKVKDKTAIEFAVGFYDALGAGKSVEEAFKFGRTAIRAVFPDIPDHLLPVLRIKKGIQYLDKKPNTLIHEKDESLMNIQLRLETIGENVNIQICLDKNTFTIKKKESKRKKRKRKRKDKSKNTRSNQLVPASEHQLLPVSGNNSGLSVSTASYSLQNALDQLGEGEKLEIPPGEYSGPIVIKKSVILEGKEYGATIWAYKGPVVCIEAEGVTLKNLCIEMTGENPASKTENRFDCALLINTTNPPRLENVEVKGTLSGFANEEGRWEYPASINLGKIQKHEEYAFSISIVTPISCTILSSIADIIVMPPELFPGLNYVNIWVKPMLRSAFVMGRLELVTQLVKRTIKLFATVTDVSPPSPNEFVTPNLNSWFKDDSPTGCFNNEEKKKENKSEKPFVIPDFFWESQ
jgi:hypothetical protein